jgi:hypothetical protein
MHKFIYKLLMFFLLLNGSLSAQITLSHNVGNTVIPNSMYSCTGGGICWARKFILADFGIAPNQSFTISKGEVGLSCAINWDVNLQFNLYAIDADFPTSFTVSSLIGSSQAVEIPPTNNISQIITVNFTNPVVIPPGTNAILVEVMQLYTDSSAAHAFVGSTASENDDSWFVSRFPGCAPYVYTTAVTLQHPEAKFYITVTGDASALSLAQNTATTDGFTYPNPVKNELVLKTSEQVSKIEAYDATGKLVATYEVQNNKANMEGLHQGTYVVKIYTKMGVTTAKILKE